MAKGYKSKSGPGLRVHNPVRTAYLLILLLEKERVPRCVLDDIFKTVKDILDFQEIRHTEQDERNRNFPKQRHRQKQLCNKRSKKPVKHYLTKYTENGKRYAEAWLQVDFLHWCFCFWKKRIEI